MSYVIKTYIGDVNSYTFTSCGVKGREGPTAEQMAQAYNNTTLKGKVTMPYSGYQKFIVEEETAFDITVAGSASGPLGDPETQGQQGNGAVIKGRFTFPVGTQLLILVGQQPSDLQAAWSGWGQSGGGGTYVALIESENVGIYSSTLKLWVSPFIVAGGAGGPANNVIGPTKGFDGDSLDGIDASGTTTNNRGAGGGFSNDRGNYTYNGLAFTNGGRGGASNYSNGGFGGGGGAYNGGGAGGGYQGGDFDDVLGTGGKSFVRSDVQNVERITGGNTGSGFVILERVQKEDVWKIL